MNKSIRYLDSSELLHVRGGDAAICWYAGQAYSQGSDVTMEGTKKTCGSDGTWQTTTEEGDGLDPFAE